MDVTAIMEKTVKNAGGVVCLQKTSKKVKKHITINGENIIKCQKMCRCYLSTVNLMYNQNLNFSNG